MKPLVTVGIPVYNAALTIGSAINSVLAQSFENWELLLVDDGSTDGSAEILEHFDDPRIRLFREGMNRGLVYRLNQMTRLARAPYFARMDADDLMHPDRLQRQMAYLCAHPETDLCGSAVWVMDKDGCVYGVRGADASFASAGLRAGFLHPTVTGRTEWFRRNPYDPTYPRAEDMELWQRADESAVCFRFAEPLLFYREPLKLQRSKYRTSCRTERKIAARYGPRTLGRAGTALAIGRAYAKEYVCLACAWVGLEPWLIARRSRPCTAEELREAQRALVEIEVKAAAAVNRRVGRVAPSRGE